MIQLRSVSRGIARRCMSTAGSGLNVFDRNAKLKQRVLAVKNPESKQADYLRDEIANRTIERMSCITRNFDTLLDFGSNSGNFARQLIQVSEDEQLNKDKETLRSKMGKIVMFDSCKEMLYRDSDANEYDFNQKLQIERVVGDEEAFNSPVLKPNTYDGVISNLSLHWINDLPGTLQRINAILKPDGMFMASMFGGDTLFELRTALQLAELERRGGISPRVSPLIHHTDAGNLLNKAGFNMLTIDVEEIVVGYPDILSLMEDLKLMGENNAVLTRPNLMQRDLLLAAGEIYKAMHADEDGSLPATFSIVFMIGWKSSPDQPKPLKRGTGQVNLKDVL